MAEVCSTLTERQLAPPEQHTYFKEEKYRKGNTSVILAITLLAFEGLISLLELSLTICKMPLGRVDFLTIKKLNALKVISSQKKILTPSLVMEKISDGVSNAASYTKDEEEPLFYLLCHGEPE